MFQLPTAVQGKTAWGVSRETVHRGTDDPEEIRKLKEAQGSFNAREEERLKRLHEMDTGPPVPSFRRDLGRAAAAQELLRSHAGDEERRCGRASSEAFRKQQEEALLKMQEIKEQKQAEKRQKKLLEKGEKKPKKEKKKKGKKDKKDKKKKKEKDKKKKKKQKKKKRKKSSSSSDPLPAR
eukprot:g26887.t1